MPGSRDPTPPERWTRWDDIPYRLFFAHSSPTWDGGDEITSYKVEYATSASFLGEVKSVAVTYLDGGSPFYKTVSGLDKGQRYYVRVSACNGQGCGTPQGSAPSAAAPYEESGAPSNVVLGVTSDSMLTLGYGYPEDDGGDSITAYRVEWDTSADFDSLDGGPLGSNTILVDPTSGAYDDCTMSYCGYTIGSLATGKNYTARVFAANAYGYSTSSSAPEPRFEAPARPPDPPGALNLFAAGRTALQVAFGPSRDEGGAQVTTIKGLIVAGSAVVQLAAIAQALQAFAIR